MIKFVCSKCGATGVENIEVIETDVCMTSSLQIDSDGGCSVGDLKECTGGSIDHFQCAVCGKTVFDGCQNLDDLVSFLEK